MDNKSFSKAQNIFFDYSGSFFLMSREGIYEEYKSYNISKDQELVWKDELVEKWYKQLSVEDTLALSKLASITADYHDYSIVEKLIGFIVNNMDKGDSLIKLIYAETLLNIACPKDLTRAKIDTVIDLLKSVSSNPITVNPIWTQRGFAELPDKEYIANRLKKDLDRAVEIKRMYCTQ